MYKILKSKLKPIIQSIFILLGYKIRKNNNVNKSIDGIFKFLYNNEINLKEFLKKKRKVINKKITIFDIGANKGQSIDRFRIIAPKSKIFSYEPVNHFFHLLKKNYSYKNIFLVNKAVGSKEGKKRINVYPLGASSFNKINLSIKVVKKRFDDYKMDKNNFFLKEKEQETIVTTVDREFKKNKIKKIHILKIDTQGFEAECLRGSTKCLKNQLIDFIQLEMEFGKMYGVKNYISSCDIILKKNKYTLICFEPKGHNLLANCSWQAELVYCNELMLNKIEKFHKLPDYKQYI